MQVEKKVKQETQGSIHRNHFKNSIHEGYFRSQNRRDGFGITILDDSSLIVGKFKNDQLTGPCLLYLTLDTYFLGEFNKGALDGNFVIRSPTITVYSSITINKIDGELVVIDYQKLIAQLWNIQGNKGQISKQVEIRDLRKDRIVGERDILKEVAPYVDCLPSATEYLKQRKQIFSWRIQRNRFWVKLMESKESHFLTFCINRNEQVVSYGIGADTGENQVFILDGLGYHFDQKSGTVYEGEFIKNKLHGEGSKETLGNQRIIFGQFNHGDIRNIDILTDDKEEITKLLNRRKKSIHIHSLQFSNSYANERPFLILKGLMRIIVGSH